MTKKLDIAVGATFGTYTVTEPAPSKNGHAYWRLLCDCGRVRTARGVDIRAGVRCACEAPKARPKDDLASLHRKMDAILALLQKMPAGAAPAAKPRLTVNSVNGNTMSSTERVKNQAASMAIAEGLAAKPGRTKEETEELRDRLRIELEVCQFDLDPERAAERTAAALALMKSLK